MNNKQNSILFIGIFISIIVLSACSKFTPSEEVKEDTLNVTQNKDSVSTKSPTSALTDIGKEIATDETKSGGVVDDSASAPDISGIVSGMGNDVIDSEVILEVGQLPLYEGLTIGKDKDFNDLCMTAEEADAYVLAGNLLRLGEGAWFDIDDDGKPEQFHYEYNSDHNIEWNARDLLYISGYEPLSGNFYGVLENEEEFYGVCIICLDGKTKLMAVSFNERLFVDVGKTINQLYRIDSNQITYVGNYENEMACLEFKTEGEYLDVDEQELTIFSYSDLNLIKYFDGNYLLSRSGYIDTEVFKEPVELIADRLFLTDAENEKFEFESIQGDLFYVDKIELADEYIALLNSYITNETCDWEGVKQLKIYFTRVSDNRKGYGYAYIVSSPGVFIDEQGTVSEYDNWFGMFKGYSTFIS